MTEIAAGTLQLRGVRKSFRAYHTSSFKDAAIQLARRRPLFERREVLKGIDLDVRPGERLGVVGRNGAGKSTLFKLMSGILFPDEGSVRVAGRVSPLIEVTAGLVPDMTGWENLRLNALIHGLTGEDTEERLQEMVAFAELEEFMETPVRYFSSGMQARLGFAVASHVNADILLIDEVLAVGDVDFRRRCMDTLTRLADSGVTVVFVSHNFRLVEHFCSRVVWLDDGAIAADGAPATVLREAEAAIQKMGGGPSSGPWFLDHRPSPNPSGAAPTASSDDD